MTYYKKGDIIISRDERWAIRHGLTPPNQPKRIAKGKAEVIVSNKPKGHGLRNSSLNNKEILSKEVWI